MTTSAQIWIECCHSNWRL